MRFPRHMQLLAVACAALLLSGAAMADTPDEFVPETGVVLPVQEKPDMAQACAAVAHVALDGVWMPTDNQIAHLESRLADRLLEQREKSGVPSAAFHLKDYHRQYCPIVAGARQLIVVAGLHKSLVQTLGSGWRTLFVATGPLGGKQFWVTYEPDRDRFENLVFERAN